jgi:hypothetical protein
MTPHRHLRAVVGKRAVQLATVAPDARALRPHEENGTFSQSYTECKNGPPTHQAQLRAIAERAPEPVRDERRRPRRSPRSIVESNRARRMRGQWGPLCLDGAHYAHGAAARRGSRREAATWDPRWATHLMRSER